MDTEIKDAPPVVVEALDVDEALADKKEVLKKLTAVRVERADDVKSGEAKLADATALAEALAKRPLAPGAKLDPAELRQTASAKAVALHELDILRQSHSESDTAVRDAELAVKKAAWQVQTRDARAAYRPLGEARKDVQNKADALWDSIKLAQAAIQNQLHLAGEADAMRDDLIGIDPASRVYQHRHDSDLSRLAVALPNELLRAVRDTMITHVDLRALGESDIARAGGK